MATPARPRSRFVDLLFGTERAQRVRLAQTGLALALMSVSIAVMLGLTAVGIAPLGPTLAWAAGSALTMLAFFVVIRLGATRNLADPSLTEAQMLAALASGAIAYALAGPARGTTLPVPFMTMMFGMFQLAPRRVAMIGLYALGCYGAAMLWGVLRDPQPLHLSVEVAHFVVLAAMVPGSAVLAGRLSRLRARLRDQKETLVRALAHIEALATHDELTGLVNRRQAGELFERELRRSARSGNVFSVALVDLDHFKSINDTHGHAAGDAVLRAFAHDAQAMLRGPDVLARWGGEEFLLLLPDTGLAAAAGVLERLRSRAQQLTVDVGASFVRLTVSAGLVEYRAGEPRAALLERADRALYAAKSQGRNRVVAT